VDDYEKNETDGHVFQRPAAVLACGHFHRMCGFGAEDGNEIPLRSHCESIKSVSLGA
jgi:hypothetical protein